MRIETSSGYIISEQTSVCGYSRYIGEYAVAAVVNSLLAEGAEHIGVNVQIRIPMFGYKSRIHGIEKEVKAVCKERGISLLEITGKKDPSLRFAQVTAMGSGIVMDKSCLNHWKQIKPEQDIVLTKWIGMEGMLRIAEEREEELGKKFSSGFMKQILSYRDKVFAEKEICLAREAGVSVLYQIAEGGVFAALWNLSKQTETGIRLDMKAISVLQETVEVCEHFRLNPYQLTSVGSFLMVTDNGAGLCEKLLEQGIKASVIGRITDNNDKVIYNGEEVRYIDRPAPDEIFKIFEE